MQRLCTESACSYSGRSVWSGDARVDAESQKGPLAEQDPGAAGAVTRKRANATANVNTSEARCRAICGVTGQKSAEAIVAASAARRER